MTFDTLLLNKECPSCDTSQNWRLQYKYGHCWGNESKIGSEIPWSNAIYDEGLNVGGKIAIEGSVEKNCKYCGKAVFGRIKINDNVIYAIDLLLEEPSDFEVIEINDRYIHFDQPPSEKLESFITFCGPGPLYKLYLDLIKFPSDSRLKYWQEQLVLKFNKEYSEDIPEGKTELLKLLSPIVRVYEKEDS